METVARIFGRIALKPKIGFDILIYTKDCKDTRSVTGNVEG
jgi:hypothetical protein